MSPTVESVVRTDAGLAAELRVSVMRLRRRLSNEREPGNQLSVGSLAVLGVLFRQGELGVGALAEHERVKPPSMTRTVSCLAEEGYVVRRAHDEDRRQVLVSISEKGRQTVLADRRRRDAWLARRLRDLDPADVAVLRAAAPILERLASSD